MEATVLIEKLSHEGRGIAYVEDRVTFVEGALPGETVRIKVTKKTSKFFEASLIECLKPSARRVQPKCSVFGICGGCSLQHMSSADQIEFKQAQLAEQLKHFGACAPQQWIDPLQADTYGYRSKARLGVKDVFKKGGVLIGFREKGGKYLTQMDRCEVLHPWLGENLSSLKAWVESLSIRSQIPQLECAVDPHHAALIVRHLAPLSEEDLAKTRAFVDEMKQKGVSFIVYRQSKGPDSIVRFYPEGPVELSYSLPSFSENGQSKNLAFDFAPWDFTQVNTSLNPKMVRQALSFLALEPSDVVLDLFCGLGNFTLPIAQCVKEVVGVEGDLSMTQRALSNAKKNQLDNVSAYAQNLFEPFDDKPFFKGRVYDKILLDPPRAGAEQVCVTLANQQKNRPKVIVYVSCNPATLARDAGILVRGGYELTHAGVMDMFPHTEHVESMAVFMPAGREINRGKR